MTTQPKKLPKTLTTEQIKALNACTTVSDQIRYLAKAGMVTADISRTLSAHLKTNVRYQWVRNVLENDRLKASYSK